MSRKGKSRHPRVFLSHSHLDRHSATQLQRVLEKAGAETYLDQDKIQAGDVLPDRIRQGIEWSNAVLLLWSHNAVASAWVGKEWDLAYELRKKIVPYLLDSTSLPPALDNLVYVNLDDHEHGNSELLRAIFGREYRPDPTTLFPGSWHASVDAFGIARGSYDLELRSNGQVEGEGGMEQGALADGLAQSMGFGNIMNMRFPIAGSWSYEQGTQLLTLNITAYGFGQQNTDVVRIRTTGKEQGAIQGQDLTGRVWTVQRA